MKSMVGTATTRALLALLLLAGPAQALEFFGYAAVSCGHDDPFDDDLKTDYSDEVAGFTNANHVCLPGNPALWAETLAMAAAQYDPVVLVDGLFDFGPNGAGPDGAAAQALWGLFRQALKKSGVPPERLFFYLADEPSLFGVPIGQVNRAGEIVHETYPGSRTLLIEAYDPDGAPAVPASVDYWGFDVYGVPDPAREPRYGAFLDQARATMHSGQKIVLVLDGNFTPYHAENGLSQGQMADVARAYYAFAVAQPDVAGMLGYVWAGGIDNLQELGVRDLPPEVRAAHQEIGRAILAGATR
ncbi:MAG: hypothetical protein WCC57_09095 [Paracoccaceae bacterium]